MHRNMKIFPHLSDDVNPEDVNGLRIDEVEEGGSSWLKL